MWMCVCADGPLAHLHCDWHIQWGTSEAWGGALCFAQGHCVALYCTVGYSCDLHRDIAWHFIVLLGILVSCTGTLRRTLLYCWVFLWVARSLSTLFASFGFAVASFRCVFLLVNLLNKVIIVYSCRGNGFSMVIMAVCAAEQHSDF